MKTNVNAVVGIQYGDEGKGRIVDFLAQNADIVIRYQGGDNAGHTVINEYGKFGLHILPSGIFNPETMNIVSAGTVVNLNTMHAELEEIRKKISLELDNIFIDERAHLIMPYHQDLDGAEELKRSDSQKIGTTKRGVGPCYTDKAARIGIRAVDLLDEEYLEMRLKALLPKKNRELEYYGLPVYRLEDLMALCASWRKEFGDHIIDTVPVVRDAVESGKNVLLEGQLGIMRDNDWGIFPYTTSSNPTVSGACNGAGIPPRAINRVFGVVKAYTTSVGGGPYPAELFDEDGKKLRDIGHEYGVTTGRPRRCGWFDAVSADYSCYMNGVTDLALTKLDVLDTFKEIKICTGYMIDGQYYNYLPETRMQERAKPVYETLPGWMADTTGCRTFEELPENARNYVLHIEKLLGTHITYVSVGPERNQLIER